MTVEEYLAFIYPAYTDSSAEDIAFALLVAKDYNAECLPLNKQVESQALYAAYLLEGKVKRDSGEFTPIPAGPLIQEKEGQLERRYSDAGLNGENFVDHSYYGRWKALYDACSFGAIVTRFG